MDIDQLTYFQKLAQLEHMTHAAEELSVSQSALSRSITSLEKQLGVPLFSREGRSIRLNKYGRMFLTHVNHAIYELQLASREIHNDVNPEHGLISIAFLHTLGVQLIPNLIREYLQRHPSIRFQLYQNSSGIISAQLSSGEVDFCFSSPAIADDELESRELMEEEVFVVVPPAHPFSKRTEVDLAELRDEEFIGLKPQSGLRQLTDEFCRQAGFTPNIRFEAEEVATVLGLVNAGLGVAVLPKQAGMDYSHVSALSMRPVRHSRKIYASWRKSGYMSEPVVQFKEFVLSDAPDLLKRMGIVGSPEPAGGDTLSVSGR